MTQVPIIIIIYLFFLMQIFESIFNQTKWKWLTTERTEIQTI